MGLDLDEEAGFYSRQHEIYRPTIENFPQKPALESPTEISHRAMNHLSTFTNH